MTAFRDLTGHQFGRLRAMNYAGRDRHGNSLWLCACVDGNTTTVTNSNLVTGKTQSCGCLQREIVRKLMTGTVGAKSSLFKHGHSAGNRNSRTYSSYRSALTRCQNVNDNRWAHYGGANPPVTVCERWRGDHGFENFLSDMGERPVNTTLGRFGDVGNYSCGHCEQCRANGWELNCAWQSWAQQRLEQKIKQWTKQLQAA
jgi:hypothetical protein